jgi:hypothetical protein
MTRNFCLSIYLSLALALALWAISLPAQADRPIFRCESGGKVTYSDSACPDAADQSEVETGPINIYTADQPTPHRTDAKHVVHRGESIAETQIRHKERCKDLADQLEGIQTKMRSSEPRGKGDRNKKLLERQLKLEKERKAEKCH